MASVPLIEAQNLAVRYPNGEIALHDVSFQIKSPSFMAIIGPNGSGKSTLVKTFLGLIKPFRGSIRVNGHDSQKKSGKIRKLVRYVPQRDRIELTVPMKVKDIVLMGRLLKKLPPRFTSSQDIKLAKVALEQVDMVDLWEMIIKYYYNPLTKGSNSLKYVLPAILSSSKYLQEKLYTLRCC